MSNKCYSKTLKAKLNNIIEEMERVSSLFSVHPGKDFSRKRTIPLSELMTIILSMAGNSLNKELYDYFKHTGKSASASAFVQQRAKLLPEAFEYLFHEFNAECNDNKTYKGYHLYAVDGSDVNIAKNPDSDSYIKLNQNEYGNILHINALYDLMNKTYVDAIIQPKTKTNEARAAIDMVTRRSINAKTILIADRGYGSMNLTEHIKRVENLDYLIRVRNDYIREIRELPFEELDTEISFEVRTTQTLADKKAYAEGSAKWTVGPSKFGKTKKDVTWDFESPCKITFRVVRFKISDDTYETIITSLDKHLFPLTEIKKLYHFRWGIETSFRELKYALGLVNFHAKKESFILQEIFAKLIMYNFCERITMQVAIKQAEGNKWTYQANFTMGMHVCMDFFRYHGKEPPDVELLISRYILPVREGRSDNRKIKQKSAVFFLYRVA